MGYQMKAKSETIESQLNTDSPITYSYEDVFTRCLAYFKNDELAATTWMNKYALKNHEGEFLELTPDDMHKRMASEFARIEKKYFEKANLNVILNM